ncbi:Fanconi anemia group C protein isoform X2 [Osmerus eperlanus]|uniref:Fanconi anemia group C protein isoform X2 n=1 Tax=Osmerus eperlanus TaxID=29151 RepID=UPI002E0F4537
MSQTSDCHTWPQTDPGSGPKPMLRAQADPRVGAQEESFWLGKAVEWGQAKSPESQRDTCLHLARLRAFLHTVLARINATSSTSETMRRMPFVGQFLGRLCWNCYVTADDESRRLLFSCLWSLYSEEPADAVERKANQWIQNVLCQLATEGQEESAAHALVKQMGIPLNLYHVEVLKKMVSVLVKKCEASCSCLDNPTESRTGRAGPSFLCSARRRVGETGFTLERFSSLRRCSNDIVPSASVACVPLVTCPEAAPLIGALLRRPLTCHRAALSPDFLDAVGSAYARRRVCLEDQALVCLWCRSLGCLEGEAVGLVESAVSSTHTTRQSLDTLISSSVLPKACAKHCSMFLIVSDVFRSMLREVEGNQNLLSLVHTFTCCLRRERAVLQPQECVSLKAFFPRTPQRLLAPLLTLPTEMPRGAWPDHLGWLTRSLQQVIEEEEEEGGDEEEGSRGRCGVFEAWFLLVQCACWVEVAVELLVSAGAEDRGALLWLLTFYHHPTSRGHRRTLQLSSAGEALDYLRSLFLVMAPPLPADQLKAFAELLLARPQLPPPLAPLLVLSLLVNFAVFSHNPLSGASEMVRMVVEPSGLRQKAEYILSSIEARLNTGSSGLPDRVQTRIRCLQDTLHHALTEETQT